MNPDQYIQSLLSASMEEKQIELQHCRAKAESAAVLHFVGIAEDYLKVINYLRLFEVVEERLDVVERKNIQLPPSEGFIII